MNKEQSKLITDRMNCLGTPVHGTSLAIMRGRIYSWLVCHFLQDFFHSSCSIMTNYTDFVMHLNSSIFLAIICIDVFPLPIESMVTFTITTLSPFTVIKMAVSTLVCIFWTRNHR